MSPKNIRTLFLVAALYDIVLGIVFGILFKPVYTMFGAELPNHAGYIQLIALYVFTFGIGFYLVYRNPAQARHIIIMGILMKLSFALVVFGNLIFSTIPMPQVYITLAVVDLLFATFFAGAYRALNRMAVTKPSSDPEKR